MVLDISRLIREIDCKNNQTVLSVRAMDIGPLRFSFSSNEVDLVLQEFCARGTVVALVALPSESHQSDLISNGAASIHAIVVKQR